MLTPLSTLARVQLNAKADEPVRVETLRKEGVEIKYLTHDKLFPPGFRPAYSLRDGFLVIATNKLRHSAAGCQVATRRAHPHTASR